MHSWFRKREEKEDEEREREKVIFPSLVTADRLAENSFVQWIFSMPFEVYHRLAILVSDEMMILRIDWITNIPLGFSSSFQLLSPLNNFPMIKFNGTNKSFSLSRLWFLLFYSLSSSWVPAIFTRNYEIYVSNYCWIHNVSEKDRFVFDFEWWGMIFLRPITSISVNQPCNAHERNDIYCGIINSCRLFYFFKHYSMLFHV